MTSSTSSTSTSRWLVVFVALLLWVPAMAHAGRKRLVVLDFEGPSATKFHDDLVKLLKKSHTVITADKWNTAAEELGADSVTDKNVKKVAKKLKLDGVITGKIEKRRDSYIVRIKLRAGTSGAISGNPVQTQSESPRLDSQSQRDLKDELIPQIDTLGANHGGGDDDEADDEEKPAKKKKASDEEDEAPSKKKSGFSRKSADDEEKPSKKKKAADDEEEAPTKKKKKNGDDDEEVATAKKKKKNADDEEEVATTKKDKKKKAADDEEDTTTKKKKKTADDEESVVTTKSKKKNADEEPVATTKKDKKKKVGDDEEDPLVGKKKKAAAEDEEKAALATKKDDETKRPKDADEEGEKKTASAEEEGDGDKDKEKDKPEEAPSGPVDKALATSPSRRAIDAVVGLSFVRRNLSFSYASDLAKPPPGYKQSVPVAGAMADITLYPLSFSHKPNGILSGLGLNVMYDRVLFINSQKRYTDANGMSQTANLSTQESRWSVGAVLRYPFGTGAKAPVLGGRVAFSKQEFTIAQTLPNGDVTDIPNVSYTILEPGLFLQFPITEKLIFNADASFLAVLGAGEIVQAAQYGAATVTGFELGAGLDYMITKSIFIRAGIRFETIGFNFKGNPMSMTNTRDTDPDQDVMGASDQYLGAAATIGYAY